LAHQLSIFVDTKTPELTVCCQYQIVICTTGEQGDSLRRKGLECAGDLKLGVQQGPNGEQLMNLQQIGVVLSHDACLTEAVVSRGPQSLVTI